MMHVLTEFDLTGRIILINNDTDEYIVYEQIMGNDLDFVSVQQGVYKFRFKPQQPVRREYLNYNTLVNEYKNKQNNGFVHIDTFDDDFDIDEVISSEFIKTCILEAPSVKYQFVYS